MRSANLSAKMFEQSDQPIIHPDPSNEGSLTNEIPERRRLARYSFSAVAEAFELRSQARVTGRCSDLSMGGCYVDTMAPFAVDSTLRITIQHDSREFQSLATVSYCHPSMGMGIKFTETKPEFRSVLRYWVADLSGEPIPKPETVEAPSSMIQSSDADSNIRLVLNELITLLVRRKVITEMEGAELLFRAFR
ncbi:MAG TPA: PilZ domain-containing protein [Candidatus Saccharimonadales bacterium]|nr:PilZ domain-containing protein [Candidatus Saccharimonadales bacterium]